MRKILYKSVAVLSAFTMLFTFVSCRSEIPDTSSVSEMNENKEAVEGELVTEKPVEDSAAANYSSNNTSDTPKATGKAEESSSLSNHEQDGSGQKDEKINSDREIELPIIVPNS